MKKLFISCPMKGRTEENIRKSMENMHKIAEIIFDQELEVIPSYIEDNPPETRDQRIWYLGKSVQMMADADYYIGVQWPDEFPGCRVENRVAEAYGVPSTFVHIRELMPDVVDMLDNLYSSKMPVNPAPVEND